MPQSEVEVADPKDFVELSPLQVEELQQALFHQTRYFKYSIASSDGQAGRDIMERDRHMKAALEQGVPQGQIERFVYWKRNG